MGATLLGGAGAKAAASELGLTGQTDIAPDLPAVAAIPTANDAAAQAARRRRLLMNQARSGRQSTMLSTTDTLG